MPLYKAILSLWNKRHDAIKEFGANYVHAQTILPMLEEQKLDGNMIGQ